MRNWFVLWTFESVYGLLWTFLDFSEELCLTVGIYARLKDFMREYIKKTARPVGSSCFFFLRMFGEDVQILLDVASAHE